MTFPSDVTSKIIDSATLYPSGAVVSVSLYVPVLRPVSTFAVFPDVQLSITDSTVFPSDASFSTLRSAPSSSDPPPIAFLLITTFIGESTIVITLPFAYVLETFPFSSIENSMSSAVKYPPGVVVSVRI